MNILADRHHSGLYHSLQLLAQRLGAELFTPYGQDWWDEWYWSFGRSTYGDDRLARQFLLDREHYDSEFPDALIRRVTLAEARRMDWAYVIASAQDNQAGLAKFAAEMDATFVVQVGNTGQQVEWWRNPIALVSSETPIEGTGLTYHQEMDPVPFTEPLGSIRAAASFVNCMPSMGACYDLLVEGAARIRTAIYGIDGPDGVIKPYTDLVNRMARVGWGWHDKAQGDGFGHVIHTWAAVGRPLIGHASHYRGRMAEPFWQDGITCIDLDRHSVDEAVTRILEITEDEHAAMCRAIRAEFERIDYDAEAAEIARLLRVPVAA
jgi:hypothetical protein